MGKKLNSIKIILSLVCFIALWAIVTDAWGYSDYIFKNDPYNIGAYIYGYVSRIIWVLPAIFLVIRHDDRLEYHKKELFALPSFNKALIMSVIISMSYVFVGMMVWHRGFWFNSELPISLAVVKYIIVGFVEEMVFRGWGYNSLAVIVSHRKAVLISTLLFVLLHWPAYFIKLLRFGVFDITGIITQSISALIWGLIFCLLLEKGKTIWHPVAAHILYDLMFVLLIGGS